MIVSKRLNQKTVLVGLSVALILVILGVFWFSYALETLDLKASEMGLEERPVYDPPFPDYSITRFESKWSNLIISVTSTFLLFIVAFAVAKLLSKKSR
jgi:amino acid transporter